MARTTRSSAAQQEKPSDDSERQSSTSSPPSNRKQLIKKRKRLSDVDHQDQPVAKLPRAEEEESETKNQPSSSPNPPFAGDLHLPQSDANKILDILEMVDTQGLLDRVFPLNNDILDPTSSSPSSSKTVSDSVSLRNLLKESQSHPLRVLRSAISQLFPISSHPRSKTSVPAAQQQRFCELALYLIEQASIHTIGSLDFTTELLNRDHESKNTRSAADIRQRKYALVQRLPTGDWWTSANTDIPGTDSKALTNSHTAHAELVSIIPSNLEPDALIPTLGEFYAGKKAPVKTKTPGPRNVSCGSFLDYGPFTSFAPTFDSEGSEIGCSKLGEVFWRKHEKGRMRERVRSILNQAPTQEIEADMDVDEVVPIDGARASTTQPVPESRATPQVEGESPAQPIPIDPALLEIDEAKKAIGALSPPEEELRSVETLLDNLGREKAINGLLEQNAKALLRLEALQVQRLIDEKDGSNIVSNESEEWKTAQSIMESLTLLASLRPRTSSNPERAVLIPPSPVLRSLHEVVYTQPSQGWHGTLAATRGTALRDDTTVHVQTPSSVQQPPATPVKPAAVASYTTPATNHAQQTYSYSGFSQQFRSAYPYTQAQATTYYNASYSQGVAAPTATPSTPYSSSTAQTQYPYNWYSNLPVTSVAGAVPGTPINTTASYASYSTPTASRAVANTVASGKLQANGWAKPTGFTPTLPPHLQVRTGGAYTPSTPTPLSATSTAPTPSAAGGYTAT